MRVFVYVSKSVNEELRFLPFLEEKLMNYLIMLTTVYLILVFLVSPSAFTS